MIRKIALGLLAFIAVAVIAIFSIASTRPNTYHVERSAVTSASPQTVHALIEDFRRFTEWSPFQKYDPNQKHDFSGPPTGVGASIHWVGKEVGEGRMTITSSTSPHSVEEKLEFIKPFPSTAQMRFTITPEGTGSRVTWAIDGNHDMMSKVMCLFMSMDAMMGKDFDDGLANLKRVSEVAPAGTDTKATPGS